MVGLPPPPAPPPRRRLAGGGATAAVEQFVDEGKLGAHALRLARGRVLAVER